MASKNNPKGRENELVVQDLNGELLIYDLNINKAYCLNPTSAAIWNLCDGNSSVADITKQLSNKLKQPVTDDLVWLALDQFKTDNLLADNEEIEIKFDGLSRREVIRKAGLASMIALPVIASLMAPTAVMAQSAGGGTTANCASCTTDSECVSGNCAQEFGFPGQICSGGSSTTNTTRPGFGTSTADSASCDTFASQSCCNGTATFTAGAPTNCLCN